MSGDAEWGAQCGRRLTAYEQAVGPTRSSTGLAELPRRSSLNARLARALPYLEAAKSLNSVSPSIRCSKHDARRPSNSQALATGRDRRGVAADSGTTTSASSSRASVIADGQGGAGRGVAPPGDRASRDIARRSKISDPVFGRWPILCLRGIGTAHAVAIRRHGLSMVLSRSIIVLTTV